MTRKTRNLSLDEVDLRQVATILNSVYPQYSLCDCARMAAAFAPTEGCVCSLCAPGVYPACVRDGEQPGSPPDHPAS